MKIQVECYSGYKSNERPIKFWIDEEVFFVESNLLRINGVGRTQCSFACVRTIAERTF